MKKWHSVGLALLLIACSSGYAAASPGCNDQLLASLHRCERVVGSLRPDKLSQARVFASDGSVYTAGQAHYMKVELRLAAEECAAGDSATAARRLADVVQMLREHRDSFKDRHPPA